MAAARNPFDLDKKKKAGLPAKEYKGRTWTEEEKAEALSGYLEIPEDLWTYCKYGTHARYVTKAGVFRPGGFIVRNPFDLPAKDENDPVARSDAPPKSTLKRFMKMQNGFNSKATGYAEWVVAYDDLAHLYAKPDAAAITVQRMLENAVKGLNDNIKKLAVHAKKLEERLAALEHRA